jgi:hypothetical protein
LVFQSKSDRQPVGQREAAAVPVGHPDPGRHQCPARHLVPYRSEHFDKKAAAILYRSAVFVDPPVRARRQELAEYVSVGGVEFNDVEAGLHSPPAGSSEGVLDSPQARCPELLPHQANQNGRNASVGLAPTGLREGSRPRVVDLYPRDCPGGMYGRGDLG